LAVEVGTVLVDIDAWAVSLGLAPPSDEHSVARALLPIGAMTCARRRYLVESGDAVVALVLASALIGCNTAGFKRVFMSLDEQGSRKRTTFYTDTSTIYCVGELVSGRADVTVQSTIRAKTLYDPVSNAMLPAPGIGWLGEAAPGKTEGTFVSFELVKSGTGAGHASEKGPYSVGNYSCELAIDGQFEDAVEFAIAFPSCPMLPPVPGQLCAGWVRERSRCEGAGARSCTCDGTSGAWQCD
jgi:hypothetical protein